MVHSDGKALNLKQKQIANRIIFEPFAPARDRLTRKRCFRTCGSGKCPIELSFYGKVAGLSAISGKSRSLLQRDTIQKARDVALDDVARLATLAALSAR
jgi:hypothetical protein